MNRSGIAAIVVLAFLPGLRKGPDRFHHSDSQGRHGAVVPQTRITAQNLATNAPRTVVTDDSRIYRITNLAPGTYDVPNLFNRVQFKQPGNLTPNPRTFGQSTGEVTRPDGTSGARQVQFG